MRDQHRPIPSNRRAEQPRPIQRWNRRANSRALVGLVCGLALVAAACGGGADAATDAVEAAADATDPSAEQTTEATLQDSGLPSLADEDASDPTSDDDADAGDSSAESDGSNPTEDGESSVGGGSGGEPNEEAVFEDYFDCMREQGIDPDEITNASPEDAEALTSTPDFIAANAVCEEILTEAFGTFELDAETEAALADRSAEMAACGREVLGVEIPDNILLLPETDPVWIELNALETTPEQDAAIEQCFEDILGDIIDDDGNLITPEEGE